MHTCSSTPNPSTDTDTDFCLSSSDPGLVPDSRTQSELSTPAEPPSRLPVLELELDQEDHDTDPNPDREHTTTTPLLEEPSMAGAEDTDAAPPLPIPVPVPRSQTPHSAPLAPVHPRSPAPAPAPAPAPPVARTPASAAHRSTTAGGTTSGGKRFTAPRPLTRLEGFTPGAPAVAVVDLGTASRQSQSQGAKGVGTGLGKAKAKEEVRVRWARWDRLDTAGSQRPRSRRLLFVAYASALQVWDTTDVEGVAEVLRVPLSAFAGEEDKGGELVGAAVLPRRVGRRERVMEGEGPVIGLAFDSGMFVVYSLKTHRVVARFEVGSPTERIGDGRAKIESFEANEEFIVISTTSPPTLHILSAHTFATLAIIPESKLAPYVAPLATAEGATTTAAAAAGVVSSAGASAAAMLSSAFAGALTSLGSSSSQPSSARTRTPSLSGKYDNSNDRYGQHRQYTTSNTYTDIDERDADTMYHNHPHNPTHAHTPPTQEQEQEQEPATDPNPNVLLQDLDSAPAPAPPPPHAVYALSHRLLAYASPAPRRARPHSPLTPPPMPVPVPMPMPAVQENTSPIRSVWGGMRTLGGLAVSAARSRMAAGGEGGAVGRFFSRSAPEYGEVERRERRYSGGAQSLAAAAALPGGSGSGERGGDALGSAGAGGGGGGVVVTVVDLAPCVNGAAPVTVVEFVVGRGDKPVAGLSFMADGCAVGVVPRDGQAVRVYQIRPAPSATSLGGGDGEGEGGGGGGEGAGSAWHVYNLRRGRTSAVVEGVEWTRDGRWAAEPSGGPGEECFWASADANGYGPPRPAQGRNKQHDGSSSSDGPRLRVPLAFTFITADESTLPPHLLPPRTASPPSPHTAPHSYGSRENTDSHPRTNFQDMLVFDPRDESLSLRRVTLEMRPKARDQAMGMGIVSGAFGATSISLPGMGGAGRLSASPGTSGGAGAFGQRQAEVPMELVGRESTVMTWSLKRRGEGEVRKILGAGEEEVLQGDEFRGRADWLAQAELSTFSKSPKILPRPIYLSHQFSFHTLGEDYHALIRRYQFDIGGLKIDVRREVQVSAYSAGGGESFVEGFAAPRDIRHRTLSSSFDEPLASALSNELDHPPAAGVLPMLPNGTPGSRPQSFRNAIPIRTIGDGMSESLGRIRREVIGKVRSPRLKPHADSAVSPSVPLEFDEEDEDFLGGDLEMDGDRDGHEDTLGVPRAGESSRSRNTSRGDGGSGPTVSTPATSMDEEEEEGRRLEKAEDAWGGWSSEDRLAVEEVERFDNIDVLGLLDEEQALVKPVVETKRKGRARRRA
ncbi:hypothetical protein LshimejAT787_0200190 [Lyophyllum shimeji]|uniref:Uncharacterized protein n=1 Tax=Lyophyllum shimeji TaxID=47721 RepID=A0A9P3PFE0_LYOSH|nr:hypothetical protein LshimejAT787_0200190 [Lyophyllum shimeji]